MPRLGWQVNSETGRLLEHSPGSTSVPPFLLGTFVAQNSAVWSGNSAYHERLTATLLTSSVGENKSVDIYQGNCRCSVMSCEACSANLPITRISHISFNKSLGGLTLTTDIAEIIQSLTVFGNITVHSVFLGFSLRIET